MVEPSHLQRGSNTPALRQAGKPQGTSASAEAVPLSLHRLRRVQFRVMMASLGAIVLVAVIGWVGHRMLAAGTAAVVGSYLVSMRDSAARMVGDALDDARETTRGLAAEPEVVQLLLGDDKVTLKHLARVARVDDMLVLNAQGNVIAAAGGAPPVINPEIVVRIMAVKEVQGATLPVVEDFLSTNQGAFNQVGPIPLLTFAAPIVGTEAGQQKPRGWLVVRIAAIPLFTHLIGDLRPGDTGETYLFDRSGRMVSLSRFEDELLQQKLVGNQKSSALNTLLRDPGDGQTPIEAQPLTLLAASALRRSTSTHGVSGYVDAIPRVI